MVRLGVVGLGKMGISHLSIANAHPGVKVVGICDTSAYLLDLLGKYTRLNIYSSFDQMLEEASLDAILIVTPSEAHVGMVRKALDRNLHVFCEKPLTLNFEDADELSSLAESRSLVNQVGYHYRFVGTFQEMKRLLDASVMGTVTHSLAEAYGPVILRRKGSTWRTRRGDGGGCLYDYAAHPINLLNWFFGMPSAARGTVLNRIFSEETDDEVYSTLLFEGGSSAQLSVNWSDESQRKMTTKISVWGTNGRIVADRQEIQVFLRSDKAAPEGYGAGWNVRYTTELTQPVWFYLRGEEYSAQLDHFVSCISERRAANVNSFRSAAETDKVIAMMLADSSGPTGEPRRGDATPRKRFALFAR